jgi:hypothetical protein
MKKVSLTLMVLLVASFVPLNFAFSAGERTAKGRVEVGGDISFTHTSYENFSTTNIGVMPRIGYFMIPKLAIEPRLLVAHSSVSYEDGNDYSLTDFGAMFNVAYHFEGASESGYVPFIFGGLGFVSHSGDVGDADEMTMIMPDIGGGIKVFFTDDALFRAELFYQRVSNAGGWKDNDADDFGLRVGVSIFVK